MNWSLLQLHGPYHNWTKRNRRRKRLYHAVFWAILLAVLLLAAHNFRLAYGRSPDKTPPRWDESYVGKDEAKRLMRYHGVGALKVEEGRVYIQRNGDWITVERKR